MFGIYGDCLWLLGNIVYAFKISGSVVKSTIHAKGDFYLKSDCIQCILFGLTFYLAPTTMIGFQVSMFIYNVSAVSLNLKTVIKARLTEPFPSFTPNTYTLFLRHCINIVFYLQKHHINPLRFTF